MSVGGASSSSGSVSVIADNGNLVVGRDAASNGSVSSGANNSITLRSLTGDTTVRANIAAGTGAVQITANNDVTLGRAGTVTQAGGGFTVSAGRSIIGLGDLAITGNGVELDAGAFAPAVGTRSIAFANSTSIGGGAGGVAITRGLNFSGVALGSITGASLNGLGIGAGPIDIASLSLSGPINIITNTRLAVGTASTSSGAILLNSTTADLVVGQASSAGALTLRGASITVTTTPQIAGAGLSRSGNLSAAARCCCSAPARSAWPDR